MSIVHESTVRLHKTTWTLGLSTEDVTEDKVWGFLFYQAHQDKRKQGGILEAGKTRIPTSNFDTEDCVALLRRSLMSTGEVVKIVIDINSLAILNLTSTSVHD